MTQIPDPKTITFSDLVAWISKQPADRPIDMSENLVNAPEMCGCVLVQYVRDNFGGLRLHAGFRGIGDYNTMQEYDCPECELLIIRLVHHNVKTYGEVQDYLTTHADLLKRNLFKV